MKKKELNIQTKYKGVISFNQFKTQIELNCKFEFTEHYILISMNNISQSNVEILKGLFTPLYQNSKGHYYINYLFIKSINTTQDISSLLIEIQNPVMNSVFCLTLSKIETNSILFKKKVNKDAINKIICFIKSKKVSENRNLMIKFLSMIRLLRECLQPQKEENQTIINLLINAYVVGKSYYDKYTNIYKHNQKIKTGIKKQLNEKLKLLESMMSDQELMKKNLLSSSFDTLINEFKVRTSLLIEEGIIFLLQIINADNRIIDYSKIDKYLVSQKLLTLHENVEVNNKSVNMVRLNKSCNILQTVSNKCNKSTELIHYKNVETLAQLNFTDDAIPNKVLNQQKNETFSVSTETTSKEKEKLKNKIGELVKKGELLETPKFFNKNTVKKQAKKINNKKYNQNKIGNKKFIGFGDKLSMSEITKKIDGLCEIHSFYPPNDAFNIFLNTAEIIFRKFFEGTFNLYFPFLFSFETDMDNLIKINSLYDYFLYLRGLKQFLFNEESQFSMASLLYMSDELQ